MKVSMQAVRGIAYGALSIITVAGMATLYPAGSVPKADVVALCFLIAAGTFLLIASTRLTSVLHDRIIASIAAVALFMMMLLLRSSGIGGIFFEGISGVFFLILAAVFFLTKRPKRETKR